MRWGSPRIARALLALAALQLVASCSAGDARPRSAAGVTPGPAMWKVADKDTTIYLFGTVHFLPDRLDWYHGAVEAALSSSTELVTEIAKPDQAELSKLLVERAFLPAGENLRDQLAKPDREALESALITLGMPVDTYDRYRPWAAGLFLSQAAIRAAGFDPDKGVESVLDTQAPAGIDHQALETAAFQIGLYADLTPEMQLTYLREVSGSVGSVKATLDRIVEQWQVGDLTELGALFAAESPSSELRLAFYDRRNTAWAQWIKDRLQKPGTVFIAVGAAHLVGTGSVQDQLRKLDIRTARVE